ncbi:hypothetical protein FSY75_09245 [Streptomyces sp. TR1341]|uniref:hypothetical protein n=1 Tax=Streptomyces sp. TR1341 TaxID=2601266 RepID=UPI00138AF5BE|nr:hypothetical protein [Streptomyces sp. TR1341]
MASHTADPHKTPLGHSIPSHRVLGWCSLCPDRSPAEELMAWQLDAEERHAEEEDDGPLDAVTDWQTCPECGYVSSLSVVTITVRTTTGTKTAGGWKYCLNCEAVPREAAHAEP